MNDKFINNLIRKIITIGGPIYLILGVFVLLLDSGQAITNQTIHYLFSVIIPIAIVVIGTPLINHWIDDYILAAYQAMIIAITTNFMATTISYITTKDIHVFDMVETLFQFITIMIILLVAQSIKKNSK